MSEIFRKLSRGHSTIRKLKDMHRGTRLSRNDPAFAEIVSTNLNEFFMDRVILRAEHIRKEARKLKEIIPKIIRKRGKENSKKLPKCEEKFVENYLEIINEIRTLETFLPPRRHDPEPTEEDRGHCPECESKQQTIQKLEEDIGRWKTKTDRLQQEVNAEKSAKEIEIRRLKGDIFQLQREVNAEKSAKEEATSSFATEIHVDRLQEELTREKSPMEDEIRRLNRETRRIQTELKAEFVAKGDAIKRLNKLASSRDLTDIQNVPDLSDRYRPTKLAEATKQLYMNEWKHAFDELKRAGNVEEDIVYRLQGVFMDIYRECRKLTGYEWIQRLQKVIEFTDMVSEMPLLTTPPELPNLLKQQLYEFRIIRADDIKDRIAEGFIRSDRLPYLNTPPYNQAYTRAYVNKCIELSWLMNIQDPPLCLSTRSVGLFDLNIFEEYTMKGPFVAYVVWPVLYKHENGPILCKGVAQGTYDRSLAVNIAPSWNDYNRKRGEE